MIRPMMILAVFSIIIGLIGIPVKSINFISNALSTVLPVLHSEEGEMAKEILLMVVALGAALISIYISYMFYMKKREYPEKLMNSFKGVYHLLLNKYFVDEIYQALFVRPLLFISENFLYKIIDVKIIDGSVNGVADVSKGSSKYLRKIQTGNIKAYAFAFVLGVVIIIAYYYWKFCKV